jgi:hypothetical protein
VARAADVWRRVRAVIWVDGCSSVERGDGGEGGWRRCKVSPDGEREICGERATEDQGPREGMTKSRGR